LRNLGTEIKDEDFLMHGLGARRAGREQGWRRPFPVSLPLPVIQYGNSVLRG
jgi:hypothetical protein